MHNLIPPSARARLKSLLLVPILLLGAASAYAQVDVATRRTLQVQIGMASGADERVYPFPYFWFNQNDFPWNGAALRLIYGITYVDSELAWFLPSHPKTAIGGGLGGGSISNLITPYVDGEHLSRDEFNVGGIGTRLFVNQDLAPVLMGGQAEVPMSLRFTYGINQGIFTRSGSTRDFVLPPKFLTQTVLGEFRLGGLEPGLTSDQGLEVYASAEAGFRSGFAPFGPVGNPYPAEDHYTRSLLSASVKIPVGQNVYFGRLAGGIGRTVDEISAWQLGGNCIGLEPFLYPIHGYYTMEFLAEDFGLLNLGWTHRFLEDDRLAVHVYADHADMKLVPPNEPVWISRSGVGAGIGFRTPGRLDWIVSYGYGINATRDGGPGNHEIALALEHSF